MKSWKLPPLDQQLSNYIECYWYLEKDELDTYLHFPRLIPNPLTHLIITPPLQQHKYTIGNACFSAEGRHLIMPSTQFMELDHSHPITILGVVFRPGAVYSCFQGIEKLHNDALGNIVDVLPCLAGQSFKPLLTEAPKNGSHLVKKLDQLFMPMLDNIHEDRPAALVRQALQLLGRISITDIESQMSCSLRTLERAFQRVTGLTMKQYEAMVRLDKLIRYLYQHRDKAQNWADLALHFGFSDQPHLIRELKKTIGITPAKYASQRNLTIDAYGGFE